MRTVFLLVFYLFCLQGFAQLKRDEVLMGTGMNYAVDKSATNVVNGDYQKTEDKRFSGNFKFGYFIRDGIAFGALTTYYKQTNILKRRSVVSGAEDISNYTKESKLFSIGPFIRAYKSIPGRKIAFFVQLDGLYQKGITAGLQKGTYMGKPTRSKDPDGRINGMTVGLHPGFVWFVRDRLGLEVSFGNVGYSYRMLKNYWLGREMDKHPTGGFAANFGLNTFSLGLCFYLCERKS